MATEKAAPEIVIIGAMKCGTSTLHRYVAHHPNVVEGHTKELDFFSTESNFERGQEWYNGVFTGWQPGQLRIDSSPNYTKRQLWPTPSERLAAANPQAKLIFLMREPISRMRSHYLHSLAAGREHRPIDVVLSDLDNHIVQTTRYWWQLEPFFDRFDRSQILLLRFDDLVKESKATVTKTLSFLGLDDVRELPEVNQNPTDIKKYPTTLARILPMKRSRGLLRRIHPRLAERPLPNPQVSDSVTRSVRDYLRDDLTHLNDSGMVDVSDWLEL